MSAFRIVRPATAFSLSTGRKRPREKQESHLDFIRTLPCLICGAEAEAAHIRTGSLAHGKRETGGSERPSDKWTVPLCPEHHRLGNDCQHNSNEAEWWKRHKIDPFSTAALLWSHTGDHQAAMLVCTTVRR